MSLTTEQRIYSVILVFLRNTSIRGINFLCEHYGIDKLSSKLEVQLAQRITQSILNEDEDAFMHDVLDISSILEK